MLQFDSKIALKMIKSKRLIFLLFIEFTQRKNERNLFYNFHKVIFRIFVILCLFLILINLGSEPQQFIYFDF